jgi:hypothetical protein
MIAVGCERCGGQFKAPESAGGRRAKCPKCGEVIHVPALEEVTRLAIAAITAQDVVSASKAEAEDDLEFPPIPSGALAVPPSTRQAASGNGDFVELEAVPGWEFAPSPEENPAVAADRNAKQVPPAPGQHELHGVPGLSSTSPVRLGRLFQVRSCLP